MKLKIAKRYAANAISKRRQQSAVARRYRAGANGGSELGYRGEMPAAAWRERAVAAASGTEMNEKRPNRPSIWSINTDAGDLTF